MSVRHVAVLSFFVSFVALGFGGVVKMRDCPPGDKITPPNGNKIIVDYAFSEMCNNDTCACLNGESYVMYANVTINTNAKNLWISLLFGSTGSKVPVVPEQNVCSYVTSGPCENIVSGTKVAFKQNLKIWDESVPFFGTGAIMVRDDANVVIYCGEATFVCKRKDLSGFSLFGG